MPEKRRFAILKTVTFERSQEEGRGACRCLAGSAVQAEGTASAEAAATPLLASPDASFFKKYFKIL